jgi:hypothetical protein
MKWTVKLERIDEAGNLHSATVGHNERPELTSESDLGLTHDDGKFLIRRVHADLPKIRLRTCKVVGFVTLTGARDRFRCLAGNRDRDA